ncbi:hypothetical protein HYV58_01845 [Candidatus Peregrinibacteria bacterium]|nr:hypothetical protein [Candidatus Peregrinibacteria bacterium]
MEKLKKYKEKALVQYVDLRDTIAVIEAMHIQGEDSGVSWNDSLQRKTRIQPRSNKDIFDIDILVVFGKFDRWVSSGGTSPSDSLDELEQKGLLAPNIKKLSGAKNIFRKRVGRWRILFTNENTVFKIWIIAMEKGTKQDYFKWIMYIQRNI